MKDSERNPDPLWAAYDEVMETVKNLRDGKYKRIEMERRRPDLYSDTGPDSSESWMQKEERAIRESDELRERLRLRKDQRGYW